MFSAVSPRKDMNIIDHTDNEILSIANPMWGELVKNSNATNYEDFVKDFSRSLALALNQVEVGRQFANSTLAKNLSPEIDPIGIIRRGEHVTVLYRQKSTKVPGEWLGRLVLGYEDDDIKIFGASIF